MDGDRYRLRARPRRYDPLIRRLKAQLICLVSPVFQIGPEIRMRDRDQFAGTFSHCLAPEMGNTVFGHYVVDHGPGDSDNRAFRKHGQDPGNPLSIDDTAGG